MEPTATALIPRPFEQMTDPRRPNRRHKFIDLLTVALLAVVCGADGWVAVAEYGRAKRAWLGTFLELPHGIPSHDTFGDLFARLDPDAFERCFRQWTASLAELSGGKLVAVDGKSLRRSFERGWDKSGMAHLVSAFVESNRLCFAQVKCDGKGKEIPATEKLLGMLDLNGAVVTTDALGCQKEIARKVLDGGGRYLLQVKDNQPTLHAKLRRALDDCLLDDFAGQRHDRHTEVDAGHGRIETRTLWVCWDVELLGDMAEDWPGLRGLVVVERTREVGGHTSTQRHYYISALDRRTKAKRLASYARGHWGVENGLHWHLDVTFDEDQRRIRKGHGAENFSRLCRIALNLLQDEKTQKTGVAIKRQKCGWENDYLLKVVAG